MTGTCIELTDRQAVTEFVCQSDASGGPDAAPTLHYWEQLECEVPGWLRATTAQFDPRSEGYVELQEYLYRAIAGKPYRDLESELTPFDKTAA